MGLLLVSAILEGLLEREGRGVGERIEKPLVGIEDGRTDGRAVGVALGPGVGSIVGCIEGVPVAVTTLLGSFVGLGERGTGAASVYVGK